MTRTGFRKAGILPLCVLAVALMGAADPTGCGTSTVTNPTTTTTTTSNLALTSSDIQSDGTIAATFAHKDCKGDNKTPQLGWSGPPNGTKSYAITIIDTSFNDYIHWIVYNIPTSSTSIAQAAALPSGAVAGLNGAGKAEYLGPCPDPKETHTYQFKVWALNTDNLTSDTAVKSDTGANLMTGINNHKVSAVGFNAKFTAP